MVVASVVTSLFLLASALASLESEFIGHSALDLALARAALSWGPLPTPQV